jgi:hypothetical protein
MDGVTIGLNRHSSTSAHSPEAVVQSGERRTITRRSRHEISQVHKNCLRMCRPLGATFLLQ